jgi:hypothetical protein
MTRKDYVAIAGVINEVVGAYGEEAHTMDALKAVAKDLCGILKADNSNFDRQRFLTACGVHEQ